MTPFVYGLGFRDLNELKSKLLTRACIGDYIGEYYKG